MTDRARRAPWGVCREGANPAPGLPAPAPPPNPALCGVVIRHVDFRGAAPSWGLWGAVPSCGTRVLQAALVWALRRGVTIFSEGPGSFRGRGVTNKDPGAGCAYGSETGISLRPRRTEQGGACPRAHPCRRTCLCTCLCANALRAPARPVPPDVRGADALLRAPRRPRLLAGLGIPPAAEGSQEPPFVAGFLVCPMPLHVHLGPHLGVKENPVGTRPFSQGCVRLPRRQPQPPLPQVTSHCGRVAEPEATVLPLHGS